MCQSGATRLLVYWGVRGLELGIMCQSGATCLLGYWGVRAKTGWLGIRNNVSEWSDMSTSILSWTAIPDVKIQRVRIQ